MREHALLRPDQEHDGELEALGRVERHQHDPRVVVVELVGVGDERDLLEELVDRGELAGRADQLAQVLQPAGRLDRVLRLELGEVAAALERLLEQVARTGGRGQLATARRSARGSGRCPGWRCR